MELCIIYFTLLPEIMSTVDIEISQKLNLKIESDLNKITVQNVQI